MIYCQSQEPVGTTLTRKDGTKHTFHPRCQLQVGHDGRHENGSGAWDDDGNRWSWGRLVHVVPYTVTSERRYDGGRMALVKRPDGTTAACCSHSHRRVDTAEKCAEKMLREMLR